MTGTPAEPPSQRRSLAPYYAKGETCRATLSSPARARHPLELERITDSTSPNFDCWSGPDVDDPRLTS